MRTPPTRWVLLMMLAFALPGVARADPILVDQLVPPTGGGGLGCCIDGDYGQTFTVGVTGILRTIGLPLSTPDVRGISGDFSGQLAIQLRPTLGGVPGDSVLAQMIVSKSSLPAGDDHGARFTFTTFFSGLDIPIEQGQQLAIVLTNVGHNGQNIRWVVDGTDSYTRGTPFFQAREDTGLAGDRGDVTAPWVPSTNLNDGHFDFSFFTSVEPMGAQTPEPGTILLLGTGTVWLARRRAGSGR
jgi:hypothetical protein